MIRPDNAESFEQVRIYLVLLVAETEPGLGINRHQAHFPHQPSDKLLADPMSMPF